MNWWKSALYDTCSLITLDKLLQNRPSLSRWFPKKVLALEVSLSEDQMYAATAKRVKDFVELCPLPTPAKAGARTKMLVHAGAHVERVKSSECDSSEKAQKCAAKLLESLDKVKASR